MEFNRLREKDAQAKYQLAVMYYDGMGVSERNQGLALKLMKEVACSKDTRAAHLVHSACFNIAMAFMQGHATEWKKFKISINFILLYFPL